MRGRNGLLRYLAIVGVLTATPIVLGASTASASNSRVRVGETPAVPIHAFMVGATPASRKLAVTVELEPRDPVGLKNFATAASTPGTPQYGHFLTVPQFVSRFGAPPAHVAAVIKALRVAGAHVSKATRNSLQVQVSGTTGQLEKTFAVSEHQLRLPSGRTAHANNVPPTLPAGVAGYVQGVIGLDNVNPGQPAGVIRHRRPRAPADRRCTRWPDGIRTIRPTAARSPVVRREGPADRRCRGRARTHGRRGRHRLPVLRPLRPG